jgi:hypothetical protein
MDRRAAIAARLEGSAVRPELVPVVLGNGDEFFLRQLTQTELIEVVTASDGVIGGRFFANQFRYSLVDDDGTPLLHSYEQAAAFVNSLDMDDFEALAAAITTPADLSDPEAVEAGKAS